MPRVFQIADISIFTYFEQILLHHEAAAEIVAAFEEVAAEAVIVAAFAEAVAEAAIVAVFVEAAAEAVIVAVFVVEARHEVAAASAAVAEVAEEAQVALAPRRSPLSPIDTRACSLRAVKRTISYSPETWCPATLSTTRKRSAPM